MAVWTLVAKLEAETLTEAWNIATNLPVNFAPQTAIDGLWEISLTNDEDSCGVSATWNSDAEDY